MIPWLLSIAQRLILPFSHHLQGLHGLRIHHQIVVWKDLSEVDKEPLHWKIENSNYTPIMTDIDAGPPDLLRIVWCGCKWPCGAKCSCRKAGLKCSYQHASNVMDLPLQMHQWLNLNLMNMTIKGTFLMLLNFNKFIIRQSYLHFYKLSYCLIWIYFKLHNYTIFS